MLTTLVQHSRELCWVWDAAPLSGILHLIYVNLWGRPSLASLKWSRWISSMLAKAAKGIVWYEWGVGWQRHEHETSEVVQPPKASRPSPPVAPPDGDAADSVTWTGLD